MLLNSKTRNIYKIKKTELIMADKKEGHDIVAYMLGILSIVMALFAPILGIILGTIGLFQYKKEKTGLGKKAKKLNIIGVVLSVVLMIASFLIGIYLVSYCTNNPTSAICVALG
jgi:uncharacterized Tic20 family protein